MAALLLDSLPSLKKVKGVNQYFLAFDKFNLLWFYVSRTNWQCFNLFLGLWLVDWWRRLGCVWETYEEVQRAEGPSGNLNQMRSEFSKLLKCGILCRWITRNGDETERNVNLCHLMFVNLMFVNLMFVKQTIFH